MLTTVRNNDTSFLILPAKLFCPFVIISKTNFLLIALTYVTIRNSLGFIIG